MADNRTPASRSALMARIGGKNTTPELVVRRLLHGMGYRFRLHRKELPGTPDIVFPGRRKAIFVHGCFWHAHGCSIGRPPKSRLDYWLPKLDATNGATLPNLLNWRRSAGRALPSGNARRESSTTWPMPSPTFWTGKIPIDMLGRSC